MTEVEMEMARRHALALEQCSLFVDSKPLAQSMTGAAEFLRALTLADQRRGGGDYVWVPREPTMDMWAAFRNADPFFSHFHKAYRAMIAAAPASRQGEVLELEGQIDALDQKLTALAPHGSCGCSYDRPGDVCLHHSPALTAAQAEVERLREEVARLRIAFHDAIRRPMGVTPDSGVEFYDQRMAEEAEARRPRYGSEEDKAERSAAELEVWRLRQEVERYRGTNRRLNRRLGEVEGPMQKRVNDAELLAQIRLDRARRRNSVALRLVGEKQAALACIEGLLKRLDEMTRPSDILLAVGEMSAEEQRAATAVAKWFDATVRAALSRTGAANG